MSYQKRQSESGIAWLEFDLLKNCPEIIHASFLRHGGHSQGCYSSLNMAEHVGDNLELVRANHLAVKKLLGLDRLTWAKQMHGHEIYYAKEQPLSQPEADILVTDRPYLGLMMMHGDCQAAIIYDPKQKIIANVHAGWRGIANNSYARTISHLKNFYQSNPADLLVCISPSIGPLSFQLLNYKKEFPSSLWHFQEKPDYFNLWAISQMQLEQSGVLANHLSIATIDTFAMPTDFFSARREKITGRQATIIAFKTELN